MTEPIPREFQDDAVAVARPRGAGVPLEQVAGDFGMGETQEIEGC